MNKKGIFITIEGADASGKTTQIKMIEKYFKKNNVDYILFRDPGTTKIGEKIRSIVLDKENLEMDYITEALLYASSRAQLTNELIIPNLKKGKVVLCDRFIDSSVVYQGFARNIGTEIITTINNFATQNLLPDLTLLLNIPVETLVIRKSKRQNLDRFEILNNNFYETVCNGYLKLAKQYPQRIKVIDSTLSIKQVFNNIVLEIDKILS